MTMWFDLLKREPDRLALRFKGALIRVKGRPVQLADIQLAGGKSLRKWVITGQTLKEGVFTPISMEVYEEDVDFSWPTPKVVQVSKHRVGYIAPVAGHKIRRGFIAGSFILTVPNVLLDAKGVVRLIRDADDGVDVQSQAFFNAHTPAPVYSPAGAAMMLKGHHKSVALTNSLWMAKSGREEDALVYMRNALIGYYAEGALTVPKALYELREQLSAVFININWKETDHDTYFAG